MIEAVPEQMEIKQAVFAELDAVTPGHAILASNTSSLSITEIGDATLRPDKVVGFHYFYPASVMPLIEIVDGDETSPRRSQAAINFAQAIKKQPIICGEVPGLRRQPHPQLAASARSGAPRRSSGLSIKKIDEAVGAANVAPMPPFFLIDLLGLDTVLHVAEHLSESYGDRFYVHKGMQRARRGRASSAPRPAARASTRTASRNIEGDGEPDGEELAELLTLKSFVEACLVLEEGVAHHRDIDFGLMAGAGMDPRRGLLPPFMKADVDGPRRGAREARAAPRRSTASASRRRRSCGAWSPRAASGTKTGQGFYAYPQADEGDQARRSSSRRAATSRSPGWPTCR